MVPFPMPEMTPATPLIYVAVHSKEANTEYIPPETRTYFILADIHELWCRICLWAEGKRKKVEGSRVKFDK